jgi:hypothetical protein
MCLGRCGAALTFFLSPRGTSGERSEGYQQRASSPPSDGGEGDKSAASVTFKKRPGKFLATFSPQAVFFA